MEEAQVINYLKASGYEVALLLMVPDGIAGVGTQRVRYRQPQHLRAQRGMQAIDGQRWHRTGIELGHVGSSMIFDRV